MIKTRANKSLLWASMLCMSSVAHATVIEFTPSTANPNATGTANTAAYGSDSNVSVGYSPYIYNYSSGYGTLGSSTGDGVYSDNYNSADGTYDLTMTFTAQPGYTVTLNSFELATYDALSESVNISVTGGSPAYTLNNAAPSTTTFTTYSPNITGTSLTLTITNLYDVGLNTITYTETPTTSSVPEPSTWSLAFIVMFAAGIWSRIRRNRQPSA